MTIEYARLRDPFPAEDIEWRIAQVGKKGNGELWAKVLAYITARAIQERLDEVFGVDGWKNQFRTGPNGGVVCRIYFRGSPEAEWCWREDGAENTDIEAVKGGLSGAMKRAGAALGIGRYLYNLDEGWAEIVEKGPGAIYARTKIKGDTKDTTFYWRPPALPKWALPAGAKPAMPASAPAPTVSDGPSSKQEPSAPSGPSVTDLKRLAKLAKERDVPAEIVTKLSEERFGVGPRGLKPHQFDSLVERIDLGEWLPDDIDESMTSEETAA